MICPPRFETWNKALQGAYRKGYEAGKKGTPEDECPYQDKRKYNGKITWSRAFRSAWFDGWKEGHTQHTLTLYYEQKSQTGQPPPIPR